MAFRIPGFVWCALVACAGIGAVPVAAQTASTQRIARYIAELESQAADAGLAARRREAAERPAPAQMNEAEAVGFHVERARAARAIGAIDRQIADYRKALAVAKPGTDYLDGTIDRDRIVLELADAELLGGDFAGSRELREAAWTRIQRDPSQGPQLVPVVWLVTGYVRLGNLAAARSVVGASTQLRGYLRRQPWWLDFEEDWSAAIDYCTAEVRFAEGKFEAAEASYKRAAELIRKAIPRTEERRKRGLFSNTVAQQEEFLDQIESRLALVLHTQNRLAEAEGFAFNVLRRAVARAGKHSIDTGMAVQGLAALLLEGGHYRDAEALARMALDIHDRSGVVPKASVRIAAMHTQRQAQAALGRWSESHAAFARAGEVLGDSQEARDRFARPDAYAVRSALGIGQAGFALAAARGLVDDATRQFGEEHAETLELRGFLGLARAASGDAAGARADLKAALTALLDLGQKRQGGAGRSPARAMRVLWLVEGYLSLLAGGDAAAIDEAFQVAEAARGQSLQKAIAASAARAVAGSGELGDLIRREQDLRQEIEALTAILRQASMLTGSVAGESAAASRSRIAAAERERSGLYNDIERRFPAYANLVNPRAPSIEQVRRVLRPHEAAIAIFPADSATYVWAFRATAPPVMTVVKKGEREWAGRVAALRRALEPGSSGVERFDVAASRNLYSELLAPLGESVSAATDWLVISGGALSQLPFALLVAGVGAAGDDGALPWSGYRGVPWVARRHSVAQLPSANALVTLRSLKSGSASRLPFAGFGDPVFSAAARTPAPATLRSAGVAVRGLARGGSVDAADLARLDPLPDTGEEITSIARALGATADDSVFLQSRASEREVMSGRLANRRVIAFATHGLVAGELNGLTQPALVLSTPAVTGGAGDGLLTMDEILQLKLDADWVVLSACNTAAAGALGEDVATGLGRAFFYAGTRAVLASNWAVETVSARLLTTGLFERQAADPKLTRAQALRATMLDLIDKGVAVDAQGKTEYSYAHPLFWAPFSLIGDGG